MTAFHRIFRRFKLKSPLIILSSGLIRPVPPNNSDNNVKMDNDWRNNVKYNYKNRIRDFSSPEKIFFIFATVHKPGEPLWMKHMTMDDFISSLIPLDALDDNKRGKIDKEKYSDFFELIDVDQDGLISLAEYLLFSTLLSIPEKNISNAFKMFDLDGNGNVDMAEFFNLIEVMNEKNLYSSVKNTNLKDATKNLHLLKRFFGENFDDTLTFENFEKFIVNLRKTVHHMEFDLYDLSSSGDINAKTFAQSIIAFCPSSKMNKYKKQLDFFPSYLLDQPIYRSDFINFNRVLRSTEDIRYALDVFARSSPYIKRDDFSRAVWTITGVRLSEVQLEVIFYIFDESGKGKLKQKDLFDALESRYKNKRNLSESGGFLGKFECFLDCVKK